jgi:uncharacterized protein (TIGR03089 family)
VVSLRPAAPPPAGLPRDVPDLLRRLLRHDPARPRLTWYGPDGERVELSAKLLDNWVAKTANLLVDELDAGPGSRIALGLPGHWRTVVWLLAVWSTGACAVIGDSQQPDVVVSADPVLLAAAGSRPRRVAIALPALAMAVEADLPPGVLDGASEVRAHGDVFVPFVVPVPADPALVTPSGTLSHGDLLAAAGRAADRAGLPPGVRLLADAAPQDVVPSVLAPLARGGSVVLHHDLAGLDDDARHRLAATERATLSAPEPRYPP